MQSKANDYPLDGGVPMNEPQIDPEKTCYFIGPLGRPKSSERDRSDMVLKFIVRPAAEATGLTVMRSDQGPPGVITQQVIQHILSDRVVVADLSDLNANVFYELALRHAFHKPVVQMLQQGQQLPFDLQGMRTVSYTLDLEGGNRAQAEVSKQLAEALQAVPESPVSMAARTAANLRSLTRSVRGQTTETRLLHDILERLDQVAGAVADVAHRVQPSENLDEMLPPLIHDQVERLLGSYADEIKLLRSVRQAGVTGIFRRREAAIHAFAPYIDEETQEIMVVGSSLKGLFQKEEYKDISDKIRSKADTGSVKVRFLLTHPVVADFRARQENRRPKDIGQEIIRSLEALKEWPQEHCEVRLYLGTPTCFAIKTTHTMLINPYPYVSVSYDSPCLILESSGRRGEAEPYFFDEFKSRHFGAWDTDLAVPVKDFNEVIARYRGQLDYYAKKVEEILSSDPTVQAPEC